LFLIFNLATTWYCGEIEIIKSALFYSALQGEGGSELANIRFAGPRCIESWVTNLHTLNPNLSQVIFWVVPPTYLRLKSPISVHLLFLCSVLFFFLYLEYDFIINIKILRYFHTLSAWIHILHYAALQVSLRFCALFSSSCLLLTLTDPCRPTCGFLLHCLIQCCWCWDSRQTVQEWHPFNSLPYHCNTLLTPYIFSDTNIIPRDVVHRYSVRKWVKYVQLSACVAQLVALLAATPMTGVRIPVHPLTIFVFFPYNSAQLCIRLIQ